MPWATADLGPRANDRIDRAAAASSGRRTTTMGVIKGTRESGSLPTAAGRLAGLHHVNHRGHHHRQGTVGLAATFELGRQNPLSCRGGSSSGWLGSSSMDRGKALGHVPADMTYTDPGKARALLRWPCKVCQIQWHPCSSSHPSKGTSQGSAGRASHTQAAGRTTRAGTRRQAGSERSRSYHPPP